MMNPRDSRFKQRESTAQQLHHALGEWTLAHMKNEFDEISKYERYVGNLHEELFRYRGQEEISEFEIVTEHFYGRQEIYFMSSDSNVQYHYTIEN